MGFIICSTKISGYISCFALVSLVVHINCDGCGRWFSVRSWPQNYHGGIVDPDVLHKIYHGGIVDLDVLHKILS